MDITKLDDTFAGADLDFSLDNPVDDLEGEAGTLRSSDRGKAKEEPLRVLLVDDDEIYHSLIKHIVGQADASIQCVMANDIAEASVSLAGDECDLVLLDFLLEDGVKGPEYIEQLRAAAQDKHLPIIVLTGYGNEQKVVDSFREGASDYLSKNSLSPAKIYRAIKNALEAARLRRQNDKNQQTILKNNQQLKAQKRQISSFYQTVSHELKSPLMGAREYTALVRDGLAGDVSAQQAEMLDNAIGCCDSLNALIEDLVDAASIENGKLRMKPGEHDLAEIGHRCFNRYHWVAKKANIEFSNEIEEPLPTLIGDCLRLEQLISNLLSNAFKYSKARDKVQLQILPSADGKTIIVSVIDTGVGMEQGQLNQIFDKFYQVEHAQLPNVAGMGLGLFLAEKIVAMHKGHLTVTSTPGQGSTFTVSLPIDGQYQAVE